MPLTLECACDGFFGVSICQLSELWFEGSGTYLSFGGMAASFSLVLTGGAVPYEATTDNTSYSVAMSLGDADPTVWNGLVGEGTMAASLFQPPGPGRIALWGATESIRQVYTCVRSDTGKITTKTIIAYPSGGTDCSCFDLIERMGLSGNGGMGGALIASSGAGACQGCTAYSLAFRPVPLDKLIDVNGSAPGSICLCASGGTEPYRFGTVGGSLPKGMELDIETGCLYGTPDVASIGTITFRVYDAAGQYADATCNIKFDCDAEGSGVNGNWTL